MDRRRRGFSMAEMVVAVLILSSLSVILVGVIPATVIGLRSAGNRAVAAGLARQTLEGLKRGGFGRLASAEYPPTRVNGRDYAVQVQVGPARAGDGTLLPEDRAREVVVTVTWHETGQEKAYRTRTVFFRQ
ncbi:MAG TPA: prepilin-type N-terminal cleavage/methylation domain-containing protein [Candidatus Nitrosotenuis sp.]|nr:prepilin-type N-terminal cleavage/methylation domain-containing protein [Candidatus Nitrosotenuis sp.]